MTHCTRLTCLALLGLASLAAAPDAPAKESPPEPELITGTLKHQGRKRSYHVHVPPAARANKRLPVVFVLHGGTGSGLTTAQRTNWISVADRGGFLLVLPEGVDGQWNDGRGVPSVTGVDITKIDDVGFLTALFDRVVEAHAGDAKRLYVTGVSNGAAMSYRMGIEAGSRIAGIGGVIANLNLPMSSLRPKVPLPVLIMNGTADPLNPWDGGTPTLVEGNGHSVLSTEETFRYWQRANSAGKRVSYTSTHLPNKDRSDDSTVERTVVNGLAKPVVLYTIHGGGHAMPGAPYTAPAALGAKNMDIDAAQVIWDFLRRHTR